MRLATDFAIVNFHGEGCHSRNLGTTFGCGYIMFLFRSAPPAINHAQLSSGGEAAKCRFCWRVYITPL
jgi:hypothetical protein